MISALHSSVAHHDADIGRLHARAAGRPERPAAAHGTASDDPHGAESPPAPGGSPVDPGRAPGAELSEEERQQVARLAEADRDVRAHEQAHRAAAGPYARGATSFTFVTGPDGKQYAVGGEVQIDVSPVPGDPEATVRKAQVIKAAANATANPSPEDRQVAQQAQQMEQQARQEAARQHQQLDQDPRVRAYQRAGVADIAPQLSRIA